MYSRSFPTDDQVLNDLGDDLLQRMVAAIDNAREDYARYRGAHPDWAADETSRGSANWIHDRIWSHLRVGLDVYSQVQFVDQEPTRQFSVRSRYVFRIKRHNDGDAVRSYPTATALRFWADTTPSLEYTEVHNLALGYRWEPTTREFGEAVISYRNAMDSPLWVVELHRGEAAGSPITWMPVQGPTLPSVDTSAVQPDLAADEEAGS